MVRYRKIQEGLEISRKPLHFNKKWIDQLNCLKKGEKIASYHLLQQLRNSQNWPDSFSNFWVNVPNPDKISENKGYVARFVANSSRAYLDCGRDPLDSNSALGVFVIRKKITGKKK